MATDLEIANRALSAVGARSGSTGSVSAITSFNENSKEADQVNLLYRGTRNDLLRAAHWDFARKTAQLALLKAAPNTAEATWSNIYPPPPWLFSYAYPPDCLKMRTIRAGGGPLAYGFVQFPFNEGGRIGQRFAVGVDTPVSGEGLVKVVLCNLDQALATYTCRMDDPSLWDSNFEQAMVVSLAGRLAMPLSGSLQLKQALMQEAQLSVQQARISDGNEGTTSTEHTPDWIRVRGGCVSEEMRSFGLGWDSPSWLGI